MTAVTQIAVMERQAVYLLASLYRADGSAVAGTDVMSVCVELFRPDSGSSAQVSSEAYNVADVVFDVFQTDGYWTTDSTGYNLRIRLRSDLFVAGAGLYRAEVVIELYNEEQDDTDDPDVIIVPYEVKVRPVYSS